MAGWFSRIIPGSRRADAEPVEYALTCRCGQMVTGVRGRRMQVAVCRTCDFQICVLPQSPYPRPKVRKPSEAPKPPPLPKRSRTSSAADEDLSDSRTPPPLPRRKKAAGRGEVRKSGTRSGGRDATARRESVGAGPAALPLQPRRPLMTPLRWLGLGMVVVILLAGYWATRQRAKSAAVVTVVEASRSARSALASSEFHTAQREFERAVAALDLLGRKDREAQEIRQQSREVRVANGLAPIGLFELISEARQTQKMAGSDWKAILRQSYKNDWFLIESNGLAFTDESGGQRAAFTLQLVGGEDPVLVRGDLSAWSKELAAADRRSTLILAGQISDIRSQPGAKGWEIILNPDTVFPWVDSGLYGALGGTLDDATLTTLRSQAQLLGVSP